MLVVAAAGTVGGLATGTTPANAATFTYDVPAIARAGVHAIGTAESSPTQLSDVREGSAPSAAEHRGASTTLFRSFIATNTAGEFPAIKPGSAGGPTASKPFSQAVRQEELANNPSTCVYCHMETNAPQVDHAIPRVQGGNATIENAQTTCGWCNASKGGRLFPVNPPPGYEGLWPPPWWSQGG
ncbi:MAG: HNH endonuclease [Ilumatobacteraceae bacterium]